MKAELWDQRFAQSEYWYGTRPNDFVVANVSRLPKAASIVELGAGEGRNAVFLARQGFTVTAVDYSVKGLAKTQRLAQQYGVSVETIHADVVQWQPDRQWDAVVVTFLHLPEEQRRQLYALIQRILYPGGYCIAEWFRPEQRLEGYTSGGPPTPALMVSADELRRYFHKDGIVLLQTPVRHLDEGPGHQGPGATVQLIWRKPRRERSQP